MTLERFKRSRLKRSSVASKTLSLALLSSYCCALERCSTSRIRDLNARHFRASKVRETIHFQHEEFTMMIPEASLAFKDVAKVPLVVPQEAGIRWSGISHGDLVELITERLAKEEISVMSEGYYLDADGSDMVGRLDLEPATDKAAFKYLPKIPGYNYSLGFVNSNSRRRAMTFYYGITSKEQTHGMCFGTLHSVQHNGEMLLQAAIKIMVGELIGSLDTIAEIKEAMVSRHLDQRDVDHILMSSCRGKIQERFLWSKVGHVDTTHKLNHRNKHNWSSWSLYQAFSTVVRDCLPLRQMDMSNKFRLLLPLADKYVYARR